MISLYRPGNSIVHRLAAGPKVLLLAVLALVIGVWGRTWLAVGVSAAVVVVLFLIARFGPLEVPRQVVALRWIIVATLAPQLIFLPWDTALINTTRVLLVILTCALLSLTTRVSDLLAATERALGPLRRIGVNPERIALLLALTITTIPTIVRFGREIRDAQKARGVRLRPTTFVVPLLVASLRHGDQLSEALVARGAS